MTVSYEIEKINTLDNDFKKFLDAELPKLADKFENVFNPNNAAVIEILQRAIVFICRRNGEITGLHVSWLFASPLDINIKILQQQLFYVKPDSGRTAYHLFKKFIDFGKNEANHIITMLTSHTNIKPSTLKSLGFEELQTMYRMEMR